MEFGISASIPKVEVPKIPIVPEVAVPFEGPSVDVSMEPHLVLDANADFGDTKFEKGPIWIRAELTPARGTKGRLE